MVTLFASIAAIIHVYIFFLESFLWGRPKTNKVFRVSSEVAEHNRMFAFNQGFYNLFLAVAIFAGLYLGPEDMMGLTLMGYAMTSMVFAAVVLIYSNKNLYRAALIQGLAPLLGLICLFVLR